MMMGRTARETQAQTLAPHTTGTTTANASDVDGSRLSPDSLHHTSDYYFRYYKAYYDSKFNRGSAAVTSPVTMDRGREAKDGCEPPVAAETGDSASPLKLSASASPHTGSDGDSSILSTTPYFFATNERNWYPSTTGTRPSSSAKGKDKHVREERPTPAVRVVVAETASATPGGALLRDDAAVAIVDTGGGGGLSPTRELFPPPPPILQKEGTETRRDFAASASPREACTRRRAVQATHAAPPTLPTPACFPEFPSPPQPTPSSGPLYMTPINININSKTREERTTRPQPPPLPPPPPPSPVMSAPTPVRRHSDRTPNALSYSERCQRVASQTSEWKREGHLLSVANSRR